MTELYEVGLMFITPQSETDIIIFRMEANSEEEALKKAHTRFELVNPNDSILIAQVRQLDYHFFMIKIWYDNQDSKGRLWVQFIKEESELKALMVAQKLFWKQYDIHKISMIKEEVLPFGN